MLTYSMYINPLIHFASSNVWLFRSTSSPHGGAAGPHSCVPLARLTVGKKKKVVEPLEEKGGLFLNALARDQMLPVQAVEEPSRQRFFRGEFSDERSWAHNFSPVLLSLLQLLEFSVGFSSCDKEKKNVLDFTSPANMYSAALLLMLAVRIYADSMEGPTGKRRRKRYLAQYAPVNLLTRIGAVFKVDFEVQRRSLATV